MRHLLKYSQYLMILGGIWQRPFFQSKAMQTAYKIYSQTFQIIYYTICFSMLLKFFSILKAGDMEKLAESIAITCALAGFKTIIYQYGGFLDLIDIILDEEQKVLAIKDLDLTKIYMEFVNYIYKTSRLICIVSLGATIGFVFFQSLKGLLGDHSNSEKPMIYLAHFPFDQEAYYKTALLIQGITLVMASLFYCMTQVTYNTAVTYVKMELKLLQFHFRNFMKFKKVYDIEDDETMMIKLIRRHQFIIRFTEDLNKSLRLLILLEFLLSSINISFVVLQLISGQRLMPLPITLAYIVILLGQLFILAWHANDINIESVGLSDAIWQLPWYEMSLKVQKMMYVAVCRSHKPLTLTIGPFNPLTCKTVINVINAAYSYVTIMRNNDK